MRFGPVVLATALPLALAACGQKETAPTEAANVTANEAGETASVAPSGSQDFVNRIAASDRFEIETSKLAADSAASSAVMAYAREMIAAHTASTAKLKGAVAKGGGIVVDDKLSTSQQATLEDMKMKKGYIFDAAYLAAQVHGHDHTLTELKGYAASGDNAALKAFAEEMIPTVAGHLEKAQAVK